RVGWDYTSCRLLRARGALTARRSYIRSTQIFCLALRVCTPLHRAFDAEAAPAFGQTPSLLYIYFTGILITNAPMTSLSLKSCLGLSGCALWQPIQAWVTARSG